MTVTTTEVARRIESAMASIRKAYGTDDDEYGATLFVKHHVAEVESEYWEEHLKTRSPEASSILDLLIPSPHWSPDEDGVDSIDFTLPGEVTNYLICVSFDEAGEVEDITMES